MAQRKKWTDAAVLDLCRRLAGKLNASSIPIYKVTRAGVPVEVLREMEQRYLIDLQAASHIEVFPPDVRNEIPRDPYRGALAYVLVRSEALAAQQESAPPEKKKKTPTKRKARKTAPTSEPAAPLAPAHRLADMPEYLTPEQLQAVLQIGRNTAFRWLKSGKVPGARKIGGLWRVRRDALTRFFED